MRGPDDRRCGEVGRTIRVSQLTIEHFQDQRIVGHWRLTDDRTLLRQLGVAM